MVPGLHCGSAVAAPHMRMNKGLFGAKRMYLGGWHQRCGRNKKAPIKTSSICIRNNRNTHGSKQRQQQQHVCSTKKERTALQHVSQWLSTHGFNFKQVGTKTLRKQAIGNLIVISQAQALHILGLLHYRMFLIKLQTIRARFLAFCRTPGAIHVALFFLVLCTGTFNPNYISNVQNPYDSSLYWLVFWDPHNGFWKSLYTTV